MIRAEGLVQSPPRRQAQPPLKLGAADHGVVVAYAALIVVSTRLGMRHRRRDPMRVRRTEPSARRMVRKRATVPQ